MSDAPSTILAGDPVPLPAPRRAPLRILLVDDNPLDRLLVVRELRKDYPDIHSIEPVSPEQFAEAIAQEEFDLAITDYQLRWTTGLAVLRAVKAHRPRCPVVMFTATGSEEIAVEAMKEGLDDYIIKSVVHLVRLRASVRTALERAATVRQVEQLSTRLAALLGSLKLGVFRRSTDGTLIDANDAFRRILALPPHDSLAGKSLSDFFVDARDVQRLEDAIASRQAVSGFEVRLHRADGRDIWAALDESLSETVDNHAVIDGLLEDISHRKHTEEVLRQTEAELAHVARVTTLGELLSGIAHEVNQPLHAIANYAVACLKTLEQSTATELDEVRNWIQAISQESHRAAGILRGIRQFVRRQEPSRDAHDLNPLLEESLDLLEFEIRRWQVKVNKRLSIPSPSVFVDRLQIQQVAVNLVRNAIEAMRTNHPSTRELTVTTLAGETHVEVVIQDRGPGITNAEQLFKPFFTTKPQGLGMGLAVSHTIITAHGGQIWASSPKGGGACFHFTIPRALGPRHDQPTNGFYRGR